MAMGEAARGCWGGRPKGEPCGSPSRRLVTLWGGSRGLEESWRLGRGGLNARSALTLCPAAVAVGTDPHLLPSPSTGFPPSDSPVRRQLRGGGCENPSRRQGTACRSLPPKQRVRGERT